jgi:hypothetical protein
MTSTKKVNEEITPSIYTKPDCQRVCIKSFTGATIMWLTFLNTQLRYKAKCLPLDMLQSQEKDTLPFLLCVYPTLHEQWLCHLFFFIGMEIR